MTIVLLTQTTYALLLIYNMEKEYNNDDIASLRFKWVAFQILQAR